MTKKIHTARADKFAAKPHPLNKLLALAEMSLADKLTLRAWKTTYKNQVKKISK